MKTKEFILKDHRVIVVDAPIETTHSSIGVYDGMTYLFHKKNAILDIHSFDMSDSDDALLKKYEHKLVNLGNLKTAPIGFADDLFDQFKNGNFYDYVYNGIYYPTAISALKGMIASECDFSNPYILIIKP